MVRTCLSRQSSGGVWILHTLPGSSSTLTSRKNYSCSPSEMQFTTRAVRLFVESAPTELRPCLQPTTEPRCTSLGVYQDYQGMARRTHEQDPGASALSLLFQPKKEESSMSETSTLIGYGGRTIGREELALVPTPAATETHRPIPHHEIVRALVETLGFRHIGVVHDEYAVSPDGMKAFGVLDLASEMEGCRFSIGLRNSHDKSMRLAMTCGYRVFVCSNMAFAGDFTPVLAKHSKSFSLIDCISVGVDRMQRNFEPMRKQVETWQRSELTDVTAKVVIYEAFVEGKLEAPKHLARTVHDLYFEPKYEEFKPRTIWSLSNAFTSAFKALEPIPQFRATAKLGEFLETLFSQSF